MIQYYVRVRTKEQLEAVLQWGGADVLMLDQDLAVTDGKGFPHIVLCLPDVARQSRIPLLAERIRSAQETGGETPGLLIRSLDELGMVKQMGFQGRLIADSFLYAYNSESIRFYLDLFPEMDFICSDELTDREQEQCRQMLPKERMIVKIYGHQPLMITNQCLNRNYYDCRKKVSSFTDSRRERFFAVSSCRQCYSIIYNGKCTWLADKVSQEGYSGYGNLLYDFTVEDPQMIQAILPDLESAGTKSGKEAFMPRSFTRGHHFKGVE